MELNIKHSITRLAYLKARIEGSLVSNNSYRSSLSPSLNGRTILANLSIGQPPIPQLLIMDTGSSTFWTMCTPCTSCTQYPGQIFNPSKSSTYSPSCNEPCYFGEYCKCEPATYSASYADKSFSSGTIGSDMLVFETGDEGIAQLPNIEFGCAHDIIYNHDPGYNGVLGLGFDGGRLSLVTQIGPKFSYCIGSLTDKHYNYNHLILGEGANLEGYTTHLEVHHGYNYLTMEGISIGENCLDIDPSTFEIKENGTGGVIIDTGSPFSYFVDDVYKLLYNEIQNLFRGSLRQVKVRKFPWMLCYFGIVSKDLTGFPVVTFHLAGGADLVLDSLSFFEQTGDDLFCMAVGPTSEFGIDVSVIGLLAQQSYNVGYDNVNGLIYFQRIDCELLSS
ncbi:aspartic proteinase nepenthesin-1-like protein [Trifolium pratense]|uniref:Aspartic proteinase nepenthesin-1-like protein n=1 Tax=Trifolium pratense TaxID=57577 RepID=A0A2K3M0U6_TRIPR|nr:aspartic proteinase nepenthesin-1-like protein [Trifolium pratense]